MTAIVLPIHSCYANEIYAGRKQFEFRKHLASKQVDTIFLYETKPVGKITGYANVSGYLQTSKQTLWEITKHKSGISQQQYNSYFRLRDNASAYCLGTAFKAKQAFSLADVGLNTPPQSFVYLAEEQCLQMKECAYDTIRRARNATFVGGVHGVGKTHLSKIIADAAGLPYYSSSTLIYGNSKKVNIKTVRASNLSSNQDALIKSLTQTNWFASGGYLDGHFTIKTESGFSEIPLSTFQSLNLTNIILIVSPVDTVKERLKQRDGIEYNWQLLDEMQRKEEVRAKALANELNLPLSIIWN